MVFYLISFFSGYSNSISNGYHRIVNYSSVFEPPAPFNFNILNDSLVVFDQQENTQYALSLGGRYKVSKRTSINIDYGYHFNRADASIFNNPLGIGVDIETGGHVFQLLFSNSQPMNSINSALFEYGPYCFTC